MFNWLSRYWRKAPMQRSANQLFLLECQIHGSHYYDCLRLLKDNQLSIGESIMLQREPNNAYDTNAIEILTQSGQKLGYVPQKHNSVIAALMEQHCQVSANIESINQTAWEPVSIRIVMLI